MMKIKFLCLVALAVMLSPAGAQAQEKIRLAVINSTNTDNPNIAQQSDIITGDLTGSLAKSDSVTLVERDMLDVIIREQKVNASQLGQVQTAVKLGHLTGCQYVLLCSTTFEAAPIIGAVLVDVETSEIILSTNEGAQGSDDASVIAASARLADQVLNALTGARAFIADIKVKDIHINRGSSSGVRVGNLYRVYRDADELAVIKVKNVRPDYSIAEVVKNGGDVKKLRRGDAIEAVSQKEAQSLIRSRKTTKKQSSRKSADSIAEKFTDKNEERAVKYFRVIEQSVDIFNKKAKNALAQDKPSVKNDAGLAFKRLGNHIAQHQNIFTHSKKITAKQVAEKIEYCYAKALELYTRAAEQGYATATSNIGFMYEEGKGVKQNYEKAAELYMKAAEQGSRAAQNNLGHLYSIGKGVPQNYEKAVEFYTKAADQGYALAENNLGFMYEKGYGVPKDYAKAMELYEKAAAQGNALAINNIGAMYANGLGVEQDYAKAIEYYRKAAAMGNEKARSNLKKLGASLE